MLAGRDKGWMDENYDDDHAWYFISFLLCIVEQLSSNWINLQNSRIYYKSVHYNF